MSILLEALRKSERDRHRSSPPDIHSGELQDPVSDWPKKGLLALLIIVAVVAIAWFAFHQYQDSDWSNQPPATMRSDQTREAEPRAAKLETGDSKSPQSDQTTVVAKAAKSQSRTPVESFQQVPGDSSKKAAETANGVKPRATPYIISTPANQIAKSSSKTTASKKPATEKTAAKKSAAKKTPSQKPAAKKSAGKKTSSQKPAAKKPAKVKPAASKKEFRPEPPPPITYWELPDAIRAKVPEIKFSVLVYAAKPSDRFVLINGARLKEGDSAPPDLIVKEIRRDGVVFKYRLYEFLVER